MTIRSKLIPATFLGGLILAVATACSPAQEPIPLRPPGGAQPEPQPEALPEGTEVLAKGPVHEAFATTSEAPAAAPVVEKQPPDPIEELPPDQKPDGENVQWIPGYWHWDEDANQFIWVSGFWRDPPPGRLWVPGSWRQVQGGWQWVSGFWQTPSVEQPQQPEIQYLPEPLATLEVGPSTPAPTATSFYVPGTYVWRSKYVWRPGVWVEYRPNWVWVPAHFCRTPLGWVFVDGYWDYTLANRGVLYAPVTFNRAVYARRGFVYTPAYVVSEPALVGALFVRRGYGAYYFGDYFGNQYVTTGYRPFAGRVTGTTFAIGYGGGRNWGYDPLWSYYSVQHRNDRVWNARVNDLYTGRYTGKVARPPVSLTQQNTVINNITNVNNVNNVTNNVTVVNKTVTVNKQNVTDVAMLAPARVAKDLQPEARIAPLAVEARKAEAQHAQQLREVAVQRNKAETAAVAARPMNAKPAEQPQTLKLEVPKTAVARAQVTKDEKKAPPPPALKAEPAANPNPKVEPKGNPNPNPKVEPKGKDPVPNPKVEPMPMPNPKVDPKGNPKVEPKGKDPTPVPNPKVEPKGKDPVPMPNPKVEPKPKDPTPMPKVEPKVEPKTPAVPVPMPKVEPKPKTDPVPMPTPKVEPKTPVAPTPVPMPNPKVEPKPKDPVPTPLPKVEPKTPVVPTPVPKVETPKVETPKVEPKLPVTPTTPKVEPKLPVTPPTTPVVPMPVPKVEPKTPVTPPPPVVPTPPKVEPKLPVTPPATPIPKGPAGPAPKTPAAPPGPKKDAAEHN